MHRIGLYWHTVRHMRPVQVSGRLRMRLYRPRIDARAAPGLRAAGGPWRVAPAKHAYLDHDGRLCLLNEPHALDAMAGWDDPAISKLWRYNLHYLDILNAAPGAVDRQQRLALLERWVEQNPAAQGTGWEPYPTSLRIVNIVKLALTDAPLSAEVTHSLAVQARWLAARLEYHLLGNHLFANAKALVFAGLYFAGPEAERWLRTGLDIIDAQLDEQILADGGHFELSPMYHALALEDLLDLVNIANAAGPGLPLLQAPLARWRGKSGPMCTWLRAMSHADGQPGLFNDAAHGIAAPLTALLEYASRLGCETGAAPGPGLTPLAASGYLRLQAGHAVALLDVAEVGPSYLPGHAHADTLSFELSLMGQRLLVNSGTSEYGLGPERLRQRASAAHNTVVIDGCDSSEVWSGFRVARRAHPVALRCSSAMPLLVECGHDGYRRLPGRNLHTRCWRMIPGQLDIEDRISGPFGESFAYLHLHPQVRVEHADGAGCQLVLEGGARVRFSVEGGQLALQPSSWHPEFGLAIPAQRLAVRFQQPDLHMTLRWTP